TINWGDGTSSAGTITQSAGVFTVSGSHTYVGDTLGGRSGVVEGNRTEVRHGGLAAQKATSSATVTDPNVIVTGGFSFTVAEGSAAVSGIVATFTDPGNPTGTAEDAADYGATINWGDGTSSAGTITQSAGRFTVSGSHTYVGDTL